jgi:hypothetical protein
MKFIQQITDYIKQKIRAYLDSWKIDDLHYANVNGSVYSDTVEFTGWTGCSQTCWSISVDSSGSQSFSWNTTITG